MKHRPAARAPSLTLIWGALLAAPAAAGCQETAAAAPPASGAAEVKAVYTLPGLPLGKVLADARVPVANDRRVLLGGIGTDLWHGPGDAADEFWLLCDRGPNGTVTVDQAARRTFLVPDYTPLILHVRAAAGSLSLLAVIPVVGESGKGVSGLPNIAGHDEVPYDATGATRLAYCPSGLDCEGLVRTRAGEFWLAEEYGPSLVHVDATGRVLARFVPAGLPLCGADYEVSATLPAIFARRKDNRGFEGLGLGPDGTTLYAIVQSPLLVPDKATGEAARTGRILAFDVRAGKPVAEYAYRFEVAAAFDPKTPRQGEMKVSSLAVLDDHVLLLGERTDLVAKVYAADLRLATNLLGTPWDEPAHAPSLEALADPEAAGVRLPQKRLIVDLTALPGIPGKIEGLAVLDDRTLAVANDNDFDVGAIDADGNNQGKGTRSRLWVIGLPQAMRAAR